MNKYVSRLVEEWTQHKKIIIAVDFDDTISHYKLNSQDECDQVINLLLEAKKIGCYIVLFTACDNDKHHELIDFCQKKNLQIDSVNKNPIELPFGHSGKVYANIFIDDRGGLNESMNILSQAINELKLNQK